MEYSKNGNEWVLNKQTNFDKRGNMKKEISFGSPERHHIKQIEYQNNKKILEIYCEYFVKHDTCVLRQFKKYEYPLSNKIKETIFNEDSTIRLIRTRELFGNKAIEETKSWEFSFFTSKEPKDDEALILTDTFFLDSKGRVIEEIHNNANYEKPWKAKYKYLQQGYFKTLEGSAFDGITFHPYNKLQQAMDPLQKQYIFGDDTKFKYEIEYY